MTMLYLIDLQNDYFHPDGKFFFPESAEIVDRILQRISRAKTDGEPILYTLNLYTGEDERSAEVLRWASSLYEPFRKPLEGHLPLKKLYYGISAKDADRIRQIFEEDPPQRIEVAGVATNVCVLANAIIMQNLFPDAEMVVSRARTRSEDKDLGEMTYQVMAGISMNIVESEEDAEDSEA